MKKDDFTAKIEDGYALFWQGIFSNFYPCKIKNSEGRVFFSSEQYFMYRKADFFNDHETAKKIFYCNTPKEAKALGRNIKSYDDWLWERNRFEIMLDCVRKKFFQNEDLKEEILSDKYEGVHFVEASPYDRIWGIGYDIDEAMSHRGAWGRNLLGNILDTVRIELKYGI